VVSAPSDALAGKYQQALALHKQGQLDPAERLYKEILAVEPRHFDALHMLGVAAGQAGELQKSVALISQAIGLDPTIAAAYANRGIALHTLGQLDEALANFDHALDLRPDYPEALISRGTALQNLDRSTEALASFDQALALRPDNGEAHFNRSLALQSLERLEEALAGYDGTLAIQPSRAEAHCNRGVVLQALGRFDEALVSYARALALRPDYTDALNNRGVTLQDLRRLEDALASYDQALRVEPDNVRALCNRSGLLRSLQRFEEALASADQAVALRPDSAPALYRRGTALLDLRRHAEALASYDQALAISPDYAEALNNRGAALQDLRRYEEALESYDRALAIRPDFPELLGAWLHTRMSVCSWTGLNAAYQRLATGIEAGKHISPPLALLATPLPPPLHRKCAEIYVQHKFPGTNVPAARRSRQPGARIRLGYFSADFREHPVSYLAAGLFEAHDRARFELFAFAFGPPARGAMGARVEAAFDQFIDVGNRSDADVAQLARDLGIDIAVDLTGFTLHNRTGIFARRAAPLQISFLGYLGTMGAEYIDYIIGDPTVIPREHAGYYTEKIAWLPHTFQVNDARRVISSREFTRQEAGLPEQGFVFCCFNNNWKITPEVFAIWMRLLDRAPGSVLWLVEDNPAAGRNLRAEARKHGIHAERLVFASRMDLPEHLARQRRADLFLDTLPYNAGATASDALWAGLPVLTQLGGTYAGRMAASLLKAVGLPELITVSAEGYESLALELALDAPRLAALRQRLATSSLTSPLFDTDLFTRHIEAAYTAMWNRQDSGLAPEHIVVSQLS
jgi:predicted O-linked N-acetylglucosamine transferase (SPINDLY family)